ncbi:hypothetical protein, partial [Microcoleus anatoxicus]
MFLFPKVRSPLLSESAIGFPMSNPCIAIALIVRKCDRLSHAESLHCDRPFPSTYPKSDRPFLFTR